MENHHIIIEKTENTAATASVILAVVGIIISLIPFLGWFSLPLWFLAIIFGFVGLFKEYKRGMAIAGIIIGLFTIFYKVSFLQFLFS